MRAVSLNMAEFMVLYKKAEGMNKRIAALISGYKKGDTHPRKFYLAPEPGDDPAKIIATGASVDKELTIQPGRILKLMMVPKPRVEVADVEG